MSTAENPGILPPLGALLLGTHPLRRNDLEADTTALLPTALRDPRTRVLTLDAEGRAPIRRLPEVAEDATAGAAPAAARDGARAEIAWAGPAQVSGPLAHLGLTADGAPVLLALPAAEMTGEASTATTVETAAGSSAAPARAWTPAKEAGDPYEDRGQRPGPTPEQLSEDAPGASAAAAPPRRLGLREAAEMLDPEQTGWFTAGLALYRWHEQARHCPRCGAPTDPARAGWALTCTAEGTELFPRTDPAIIAAVVHTDEHGEERILLGRSARWPADRYSTFAGFVEAGESLEAAVAREVGEEAGVRVVRAEYRGSQPWPFPRSLMLGFRAVVAEPGAARPDGTEIARVRWFTRRELAAQVRAGRVRLPGPVSIAHHLIADWYGGTLPEKAPQNPPEKAPETLPQNPEDDSTR